MPSLARCETGSGRPSSTWPDAVLERIAASGAAVSVDEESRAEAGRDWWPLAIGWAVEGAVPQRPAAVVRPDSVTQVSAVLAACNEAVVPVTATAGRSGVCGGAVPVHGGVALDMTGLDGLVALDETSLLADVRAGTFGPDLEAALGSVGPGDGYTLGHWPQSMDLSTVGGWLACRGAGQYSTSLREDRGHGRGAGGGAGRRAAWCGPRAWVPARPRVPT